MKYKFKKGDRVVNTTRRVKDVGVIEVGDTGTIIDGYSSCPWVKWDKGFSSCRIDDFMELVGEEKEDLRELITTGRVIELRNGNKYIAVYIDGSLRFLDDTGWFELSDVTKDLKCVGLVGFDIMKIYECDNTISLKNKIVIWQREPKKIKMSEVKKHFGEEIEIVEG